MSALAVLRPQPGAETPEAYAEDLYKRHHRAIFRLCLSQLRRREDADDAVQTTFIYALLSLRRGVVPQMELPWLMTIAKNACSTRRRSGVRRGEHETAHDLDSLQDRLPAPERADVASGEDFRHALADVPENQRKALLLREWRGMSYDEIGTELGLSQAATEALLFRARQNVAQRLSQRVGVRTLNGGSLIAFVRNLFETTVAKTAALGAGAVLTVTSLPAAQPQHTVRPLPATAPATAPVTHAEHPNQRTTTGTSTPARAQRTERVPRTPVSRPAPRAAASRPKPAPTPRQTSSPEPQASAAAAPSATHAPPADSSPAPVTPSDAASLVDAAVELPALPVDVAVTVPEIPVPLPTPVQDVVDAVGVQVQVTTPAVSVKLP